MRFSSWAHACSTVRERAGQRPTEGWRVQVSGNVGTSRLLRPEGVLKTLGRCCTGVLAGGNGGHTVVLFSDQPHPLCRKSKSQGRANARARRTLMSSASISSSSSRSCRSFLFRRAVSGMRSRVRASDSRSMTLKRFSWETLSLMVAKRHDAQKIRRAMMSQPSGDKWARHVAYAECVSPIPIPFRFHLIRTAPSPAARCAAALRANPQAPSPG